MVEVIQAVPGNGSKRKFIKYNNDISISIVIINDNNFLKPCQEVEAEASGERQVIVVSQ